jgi:hypothetical protein
MGKRSRVIRIDKPHLTLAGTVASPNAGTIITMALTRIKTRINASASSGVKTGIFISSTS